MRWLFAILAYGLLTLGCALALYFFEIGGIEKELKQATKKALVERLEQEDDFPGGGLTEVHFDARRGTIAGVANSEKGVEIAKAITEELAQSGLPDSANTRYQIAELKHDWKRRPHFRLFAQEETIALRGDLAPSTLTKLKKAVKQATGTDPTAPIDLSPEAVNESEVVGQDGVAVPKWEDTFADFVTLFFQSDRIQGGEISVSVDQIVTLTGVIDTEGDKIAVEQTAREDFDDNDPKTKPDPLEIVNLLEVKQGFPSFEIKTEGDLTTIEGAVPSEETKEALLEFIRSMGAPGQSFAPAIQILPDAPEPNWLPNRPDFFRRYFKDVNELGIIIGPDTAFLGGQVSSKAIADELAKEVQAQLSSHTVESRLRYPEETP